MRFSSMIFTRMSQTFPFSVLLMAVAVTLSAQDFQAASSGARADLEQATAQLAAEQSRIGEEKVPLARQLNDMEEQVLAKREALRKLEVEGNNRLTELNALKQRLDQRQQGLDYVDGLLNEYARIFESKIHITEIPRFQQVVNEAKSASEIKDLSVEEKLERQFGMVQTAIERLKDLSGGSRFEGKAIAPSGVVENGQFLLLGPLALFSSGSGTAGIAQQQLNKAEPVVVSAGSEVDAPIAQLVASGKGDLPIDATLGDALKIAATKESFSEHVAAGGPTMVPILGLGILSIVIGVFKWFQISSIRMARPRDLQVILDRLTQGKQAEAFEHARTVKGPVGELLEAAVSHADEPKEYIEEVLYEKMLITRPRLEKMLPFVALTAATAPLLGLLGTVTGMINTFRMISVFGTGDPKTLSSGISEALVTTEFGLIVAIPALLIHAVISRKVKSVLGSMEQLSVAFINGAPEPKTQETQA